MAMTYDNARPRLHATWPPCGLGVQIFVVAVVLTLGVGAGDAQECISQEAQDRLTSCPTTKRRTSVHHKPEMKFSDTPHSVKKRDRTNHLKPAAPNNRNDDAIRDERRERLEPKAVKLLLQEIAGVEQLFKSTPKNDADRPRLMRRLAEGYVELESSAFRDKVTAETKAQALRTKNPTLAAKHKKRAKRAVKFIKTARRSAIKYYQRLKNRHPGWCQFPKNPKGKRGCTDEVLYYLAYEYEQAGQLDKARAAYLELTENWKKSRLVPRAYLAFGELFFNEAQGDPSKWDYAANFYKEVLKYKAPDNKLYGYAAYKLAYVHWNQGDYDKAIEQFTAVIEFGQKYPQVPNATGLATSARRDIIPVYTLKGDPKRAHGFFRPLSGDRGVDSTATFKMMEDLGQNLLDTGHYAEAVVLYKDLMSRNRGDSRCSYQAQITVAVMASKSGEKRAIVAELNKQLAVYKAFQQSRHAAGPKLACANQTASLLSETAMAWHLEAVGSGGVRGTNDEATMRYSGELYRGVVGNFTRQQFRKFKFPRIVKEDWPSIAKLHYAMANLLYHNKDWQGCGPAFDAVVAEDRNGPLAAEAALVAALCYQELYLAKHADGSDKKRSGDRPVGRSGGQAGAVASEFAPKAMGVEQKNMLAAFDRYTCYVNPPKKGTKAIEQYVDVKYARARTYYEAQHWEEAAAAFRDIAINHAGADVAVHAAQLYLHSIDILENKRQPHKPGCNTSMQRDVPIFIKSFCADGRQVDEDQCTTLRLIERNLIRRNVGREVEQCDEGKATGCIKKYEKAGDQYYGIWKKYGEKACEAHARDPRDKDAAAGCARNDEVLYNAARAYQAARLIAKAIDVRRILISSKYGLGNTELAKKSVYEIGGNYQAIAVYELAADWYERFARDYPTMEKAPDALSDAVVLRLGLGDSDKAITDAALFNDKYGRRKPAQAAQIAYAIGAHYAERDNWRKAERTLSRAMSQIDRKAAVEVRVQAHALLGRIYANMKRTSKADDEYNKVRVAWRDPAATVKAINAGDGTVAVKRRRLGKVLTALGEAHYYFAEKRRAAVNTLKFPQYRGTGDRADVDKFIKTRVKDWMTKKRRAIMVADAAYQKVLRLQPHAPPKWVIKSGATVGDMWGRFVADFRSAPYPRQWDSPGFVPGTEPPLLWAEVKAMYINALVNVSHGEMIAAKKAYETCLDYSLKFQYFDEDSRACEEWLSKTFPNEYHLIDEFRGAPTQVNSGLVERHQVLDVGGHPRRAGPPGFHDRSRNRHPTETVD